ncbi:hypothetical protein VTK56DRAFT_4915 [Thermocarpiscus australiensis]
MGSPPPREMVPPETGHQESYPHAAAQEPPQDVYYDPDVLGPTSPETQLPYQANEPTQVTSGIDGNVDQEIYGGAGYLPDRTRRKRMKNEKHRWLLPLMSAATLGWGMEALEDQYHAAAIKASRFSFRKFAAKLLGLSKSKKDKNAANDDTAGAGNEINSRNGLTDPSAAGMARGEMGLSNDMGDSGQTDKNRKLGLFGQLRKKMARDPNTQDRRKKRGMFAWLFGSRKDRSAEQTPPSMYLDGDTTMAQPQKKRGFFARLFGRGRNAKSRHPVVPGQGGHDGSMIQPRKKKSLFARLFGLGRKSKPRDPAAIGHGVQDDRMGDFAMANSQDIGPGNDMPVDNRHGFSQPVKKPGLLSRLFGRRKKSKPRDGQVGHGPGDPYGEENTYNQDGLSQRPKKRGLFAELSSSRNQSRLRDREFSDRATRDGNTKRAKRRGLFGRLFGSSKKSKAPDRTDDQDGAYGKRKKPGFFSRLFGGRRRKTKRSDDIELGHINQNDQVRLGGVTSGSSQLMQDEHDSRKSAAADVMKDRFDNIKERKKKKKQRGVGLFHQASARRSSKKGRRQSAYRDGGDGTGDVDGLARRPKPARKKKKPGRRVLYGPIAPSEGISQHHVTGPRQKKRGVARTAAAAVNPGNWFWMDVYWK